MRLQVSTEQSGRRQSSVRWANWTCTRRRCCRNILIALWSHRTDSSWWTSAVDFMDSTGLSVIVSAVASMRPSGRSCGWPVPVTALRRSSLTGIDQRVGIFETVAEAVT